MNILVIFSDQQHKYALGCVDKQFITPNLDALAADGMLFTNAYSNNPVCGPYRGCLMTGQFTCHNLVYRNAFRLPEGTPTIAEVMEKAGYETSYVGKWHLGGDGAGPIPAEIRGGFRHFIGYQCYNGFDPHPPFNNRVSFFDENDAEHVFDRHRTDVTTDLALERLRGAAGSGRPFMMMVSYQAPHYPEQPSDKYAALYENTVFDVHPGDEDIEPYTPTNSPRSPRNFEECPDWRRYGGNMNVYRRLYAGLVSQVDAGVGRIIDELKRLDLYDDTLIIYTSDHGDMQGSHGLKNKCQPYEKSAGVPFIARMPGGARGIVSDALVSAVDIFPTAEDAAGVGHTPNTDGHSLFELLKTGKNTPNDYVISEYVLGEKPWRMIRMPKYKLTVTMKDYVPLSLFDMENDPYELNDVKDAPELADIVRNLRGILLERTCEIGDVGRPGYQPSALAKASGNS